jgi:copper chaperone
MSLVTTHLKTSGMHCASCSMLVALTLDDLDGVTASKTDHASGETVVTYESDAVDVDAILDAIRGAGYEAEVVS